MSEKYIFRSVGYSCALSTIGPVNHIKPYFDSYYTIPWATGANVTFFLMRVISTIVLNVDVDQLKFIGYSFQGY